MRLDKEIGFIMIPRNCLISFKTYAEIPSVVNLSYYNL